MPENTLLRYFFSSGSEVDPEDRFHLNRKTRTRRLKEISDILRKHHFLKGFTPEAFRAMLEDLGPSFVKIGQTLSTRSEILPKAYCDELAKLQMECDSLPFEAILEALDDIYGDAQGDVFDAIDPTPLGSASLAQVHKARLVTGEIVAVKIQRPGVKTTMAQDIDIMRMVARYAARFMKDEQMLDLRDVVEELWATFLEETDFQREAANLEEFARLNKGVAFIDCPKVHTELCGEYVLVMEYIDGIPILATDRLRNAGYDLEEIGEKILDNYASQILDHGFFHADPHPGNILVRGDDIVWIDLGMVGQLSALERALIGRMFRAVAENDPYALMEALLGAVRSEGPVNHGRLLSQLGNLLVSYTTVNLADINVGSALMDVFGVLQTQNLALPPSFTLLARGMVTIEGVLVDIAPDTSVIDIIAAHVKRRERTWEAFETKAREFVSTAATSAQAAVRLPTQASHTLDMIDRGQVRVGADLGIPIDAIAALYSVSGTVAMALISAGLFIGSSLLATTNMHPQFLGVPLLGVLGYVGAFVLGAYVVWRNLVIRHRQKNEEKL